MLDMTGKSLYPDWEQKNFLKKRIRTFFSQKSRIVPKNEKGDPLGFININFVAKYQKNSKGGLFWDIKKFSKKKSHIAKQNWKGGPFSLFRFFRLRKKGLKKEGGPFALSLHWPNSAWVVLSVSVKSGTYTMRSVVRRKKREKN